jgi:flagellar operon protein
MIIQNRPIPPIRQVQGEQQKTRPIEKKTLDSNKFAGILQQQIQSQDKLKFSKHASMRLDVRQISLSDDQMNRLEAGVNKAEAKGIKESLVLMDNVALVVNIENKTVVTALDQSEAREHVFTNIDGAVLL